MRAPAVFLIIIFFVSAFAAPVSAHVLKTDGTIGAVLHIDPHDDPIANDTSTFYLEIKDTTGRFQPKQCSCIYIISEGGKQIYSDTIYQRISTNSISAPVFTFVFARKDVYTLTIEGQPTTPGLFQPFTLIYDIRVDREAEPQTDTNNQILNIFSRYFIVLGILVIVFLFFGYQVLRNRHKL